MALIFEFPASQIFSFFLLLCDPFLFASPLILGLAFLLGLNPPLVSRLGLFQHRSHGFQIQRPKLRHLQRFHQRNPIGMIPNAFSRLDPRLRFSGFFPSFQVLNLLKLLFTSLPLQLQRSQLFFLSSLLLSMSFLLLSLLELLRSPLLLLLILLDRFRARFPFTQFFQNRHHFTKMLRPPLRQRRRATLQQSTQRLHLSGHLLDVPIFRFRYTFTQQGLGKCFTP